MKRGLIQFLSLVAMLIAPAGATAADVNRVVMTSAILGEDRPLNVILPEEYSSDGAYPVVYALDGGTEYALELAQQMHGAHGGLIIVGIENVDRNRDMFPEPLEVRSNKGGGGKRFLDYLAKELIPWVEERFAADGYRILSGQSNSGFFVLYAMLNAPDGFDAYLAVSPMVGWDVEMFSSGSIELLSGKESFPKVLYMSQGDDDFERVTGYLPAWVELLSEISPADFRWRNDVVEGGGHVPISTYGTGIAFIFGER